MREVSSDSWDVWSLGYKLAWIKMGPDKESFKEGMELFYVGALQGIY